MNKKNKYIALYIFVVILAIYLLNVVFRPVRIDEAFSSVVVGSDLSYVQNLLGRDVHPPLYFYILKILTYMVGNSVVVLRGFSFLCVLSSVYFLRKIAVMTLTKCSTKTLDKVSLAVLIMPVSVALGSDARPYAMASLLMSISTYLFLLQDKRKDQVLIARVAYGVSLAACFYTAYLSVLIGLVHFIYAMIYIQNTSYYRNIAEYCKRYYVSIIVFLTLITPQLIVLRTQLTYVLDGYWIPPLSFGLPLMLIYFTVTSLTKTFHGTIWMIISSGIVLYFCMLAVTAHKHKRLINRFNIVMLAPVLLQIFILILLSLPPRQSIFETRYIAPFLGFFYFGLCMILVNKLKTKWHTIFMITILLFNITSVAARAFYINYRVIYREITSDKSSGVIIQDKYRVAMAHYYAQNNYKMLNLVTENNLEGALVQDFSDKKIFSLDQSGFDYNWFYGDVDLKDFPGFDYCGQRTITTVKMTCLKLIK